MSEEQDKQERLPEIKEDVEWKEQIAREKEELQKQLEEAEKNAPQGGPDELPPASIPILLSTLATQVMAALGQFPDPSGATNFNKPLAKHLIDTVAMLEEKTKGNLDAEEAQMLDSLLHEMRMIYVAAKAPPTATDPEKPKSNIVLP